MEIPASSSRVYERDGYFDAPTGEVEGDESSSRPFQFMSSPPTSLGDDFNQSRFHWSPEQLYRDTVGVEHPNEQGEDAANLSDSRPSFSNSISSPEFRSEFDERGLPSFIRFPDPSEEYGPSSIYGTLFLHSDPWNVIGGILDRGEQALIHDSMGSTGQTDEYASMNGSGNEWRTTSFMDTGSIGESQDDDEWLAAEESPSMFGLDLDSPDGLDHGEEGIEFESMECEEEPSDVEMDGETPSPFTKRGSPVTRRHSSHLELYLPQPSVMQHTGSHPTAPVTPEVDQLHGSDVRADGHDADNCDGIEGPSLGPPEMETSAVRLEPVEVESLLSMPELVEVDGRYVGPSLFSNEPDDDDDGW
jgi:hypothetical protein